MCRKDQGTSCNTDTYIEIKNGKQGVTIGSLNKKGQKYENIVMADHDTYNFLWVRHTGTTYGAFHLLLNIL